MKRLFLFSFAFAAACGGGKSVTAPPMTQPTDTAKSYAGFDVGIYPGDATLQAWKYPSSPYRWVGYYLPAPCHRDVSFVGKRAFIASLGWGITAIYVGQQDWANMSVAPAGALANRVSEELAVCSASLLSAAQGTAEAADAVARLQADGFPDGSTVFLDVEHVTAISQPLLDYYRAWVTGILADGHYKPGVYAHKANAATFYSQTTLDAHGAAYSPAFWIASWSGFSLTSKPTDVGIPFAQLWQGTGGTAQTYNGVTLSVDANVSTKPSPSAP